MLREVVVWLGLLGLGGVTFENMPRFIYMFEGDTWIQTLSP